MGPLENPKYEKFCQAISNGFSRIDAYAAAGFKRDDGNARKLAARPYIVKRIAELARVRAQIEEEVTRETLRSTQITKARIIEELAKLAFCDIRQVTSWKSVDIMAKDADGEDIIIHTVDVHMKDSDQLDEMVAKGIVEIKKTKEGVLHVKLADKRQALMDIAKLQGYVIDRKELAGVGDYERFTTGELELIVTGRLDPTSARGSRPPPQIVAPISRGSGEPA